MNEETKPFDILQVMIEFFQGFVSTYFEDRQDVVLYQKKKKLTLCIPNEDQSDTTLVRCTKIDDSTVSVVVYKESNPGLKLYSGHYNKTCDDPDRNFAKLSKLSVDISIPIFGNQDTQQLQTNSTHEKHTVKVDDIVRVTSVDTVEIMEHHVLAVGFDGQEPIRLSVPKEQLDAFTIGNKMAKLPFGFQLLERNPTIH